MNKSHQTAFKKSTIEENYKEPIIRGVSLVSNNDQGIVIRQPLRSPTGDVLSDSIKEVYNIRVKRQHQRAHNRRLVTRKHQIGDMSPERVMKVSNWSAFKRPTTGQVPLDSI